MGYIITSIILIIFIVLCVITGGKDEGTSGVISSLILSTLASIFVFILVAGFGRSYIKQKYPPVLTKENEIRLLPYEDGGDVVLFVEDEIGGTTYHFRTEEGRKFVEEEDFDKIIVVNNYDEDERSEAEVVWAEDVRDGAWPGNYGSYLIFYVEEDKIERNGSIVWKDGVA